MRFKRSIAKTAAAAAAGLIAAATFATPAHAEGGFDSYVTKVIAGFDSRRWDDKNVDSTSTSVGFWYCKFYLNGTRTSPRNGGYVRVSVREDISYWPDRNLGAQNLHCQSSDTDYWGDVRAGKYYFHVNSVDGWTDSWTVSADPVKVRY